MRNKKERKEDKLRVLKRRGEKEMIMERWEGRRNGREGESKGQEGEASTLKGGRQEKDGDKTRERESRYNRMKERSR